MKEIELFVLIDSNGNYGAAGSEEACIEDYEANDTAPMRRMIRIVLNVPLPQMMDVPAIDVPEEKLTVQVK